MKTAALAALTTLALAGARAAAPAGDPAPLPLVLSGTGPFYTLTMDAPARRLSAAPGLADLRVRNAAGQAMAFAWAEAPQAASAPQRVAARLSRTTLPVDAAASTGLAAPGQSWIVDTRDAGYDLLRLELGLERGTQGVWTLRLEASDDQQHWRTLREDAQLVRLQALPQVGATGTLAPLAGRESASGDGVDLDDVPARYLRLTTAPRSGIPPLVSAAVLRAARGPAPAPIDWSAPIAPSRCEQASCDYPLPANTPVAAVQVTPSDIDTLVEVVVRGQPDAGAPPKRRSLLRAPLNALRLKAPQAASPAADAAWENAAMASVYWLSQPDGAPDLHSPPIRLDGGPWRALRLETLVPISQLGHDLPAIRIGVRRRSLVFEARGGAPFVLARARAGDTVVPLPLSALMPDHAPGAPLPEATATLAPDAAPVVASAASAVPDPAPEARRDTATTWAAVAAGVAAIVAVLAAWWWRRRSAGR